MLPILIKAFYTPYSPIFFWYYKKFGSWEGELYETTNNCVRFLLTISSWKGTSVALQLDKLNLSPSIKDTFVSSLVELEIWYA